VAMERLLNTILGILLVSCKQKCIIDVIEGLPLPK